MLALVVAGCAGETVTIQPAVAAAPQKHDTRWVEPAGEGEQKLVYEVRSFEVTEGGWQADVAIENRTDVTWRFPRHPVYGRIGLRMFASGELDDLQRRIDEGDLPGLRAATAVAPPLPGVLGPGQRWAGRIAGRSPLAVGRWVRIEFPVLETATPPEGLTRATNWITHRALRLS